MGKSTVQINFWNINMKVEKVLSAPYIGDFKLKTLSQLGKRLDYAALHRVSDGSFLLEMQGGQQIRFIQG
jgi:hypothetical protein